MEHIRSISGNFYFTHTAPEVVLLLPRLNRPYLSDMHLSFWCEHSLPSAVLQTSEVKELNVYIGGVNITTDLLKSIIKSLYARPSSYDEYARAMSMWLELLEVYSSKLGLGSPGFIDEQRRLAKKFSSIGWENFFEAFSTTNFGFRGGLHPLNFLFKQILIEPISIRSILYPKAGLDEYPLNNISDPRVVVSSGKSRLYEGEWTPIEFSYEGLINITVSSVYNDSWELEMKTRLTQIASEVATLGDGVRDLAEKYVEFEIRAAEFKSISESIATSMIELTSQK